MDHTRQFFIDGHWVEPLEPRELPVIDPATEQAFTGISLGGAADVDRAVAAARRAFERGAGEKAARLDLLRRIMAAYEARMEDLAVAISREMGAPLAFARDSQAWIGAAHLRQTIASLESLAFEERRSAGLLIAREPVGVAGLITPWNWPMNQIVCKVAPAIAAGCACVLKPSEIAPLSGMIFAEIMEAAGTPAGLFNLVQGDGAGVGEAMARHPDVDVISFTGSTRAGVMVARLAADSVKRVLQELGGKSPNILLPDADIAAAAAKGVRACFGNSGQSCDAPSRLLVPRDRQAEAVAAAKAAAEAMVTGAPDDPRTDLGPVVSLVHWEKIQRLIRAGMDEGATLVTGGAGRPDGLTRGYYVKPTVFADVTPGMTIAREEVFGPVLAILPYDDVEQAIRIANDTPYGLAAYVQGTEGAATVARRLRAGNVSLNYPEWTAEAPFGGYKQSGNGREYAEFGLHDFLEIKAVIG